jgi:hypothetical protein
MNRAGRRSSRPPAARSLCSTEPAGISIARGGTEREEGREPFPPAMVALEGNAVEQREGEGAVAGGHGCALGRLEGNAVGGGERNGTGDISSQL